MRGQQASPLKQYKEQNGDATVSRYDAECICRLAAAAAAAWLVIKYVSGNGDGGGGGVP